MSSSFGSRHDRFSFLRADFPLSSFFHLCCRLPQGDIKPGSTLTSPSNDNPADAITNPVAATTNSRTASLALKVSSSSLPSSSSSVLPDKASAAKLPHTALIGIVVVVSLLVVAVIAFTWWRRSKAKPSSSSRPSALQRNLPSSSLPTSQPQYSSLSVSAGKSTR